MPTITLSGGLTLLVPTVGTDGSEWVSTFLDDFATPISEHDHTGSGKGLQLGTNAIQNSAISLAKMANIATDRLIGRDTAGTGAPEALTVGGGLEFSGAGGIQRSALTGNVTASAGSNTTTIAAGVVTESMLADDAASRSCLLGMFTYRPATANLATTLMDLSGVDNVVTGASILAVNLPKAAKVTHLSFGMDSNLVAGTATLTLYKNDLTTGKTLVHSSAGAKNSYGSIVAESFAVGDLLELAVATSAGFSPTGGVILGAIWGHFTE